MRSLIVAIVIGTLTVMGSVSYSKHLDRISSEMMEKNREIETEILKDNYRGAAEKTKELSKYVRKKRTVLDAVGNHQELDEIERNLSELVAFSEDEMHADAMAKCYSLDFLIKALPRNFKMKIENIL